MKLNKKDFIFARARNIGIELAEAEFARIKTKADEAAKNKVRIYLDEYGNEVHVRGPLVDRVRKIESLSERIARYDRLAASVRASRAAMMHAMGEMFTDEADEDPNDDSLLDNVPEKDDFGEDHYIKQPAAPEKGEAAANGSAALSGDEPVTQPSAPAESAIEADGETVEE